MAVGGLNVLRTTATAVAMLLFVAMFANSPVLSQDKPFDFIERVVPGDFEQVDPGGA